MSLTPGTESGKAPTLYDVAKVAGVSHQTVSRYVKGHTNIGPEIRVRIEAGIAELGYKPNLNARSLATSRSHRIGALVYEIGEVGPARIIEGASVAAREAGYILDIVSLDPTDGHAIEQSISLLNQNVLAGIMVFAPTTGVLAALEKISFSIPVLIESGDNETQGSIGPNANATAVGLVLDHLISLGHRRFFQISGPLDWLASRDRARAYLEIMKRRGLKSVGTVEGDWTSQSGYDAGLAMPLGLKATALVAANDQMALGAIAALSERGVRIPQEMSVVGFDAIPESKFFIPPLTTVWLDFEMQGRIAISKLLGAITGVDAPDAAKALTPRLLLRASSTTPPANG